MLGEHDGDVSEALTTGQEERGAAFLGACIHSRRAREEELSQLRVALLRSQRQGTLAAATDRETDGIPFGQSQILAKNHGLYNCAIIRRFYQNRGDFLQSFYSTVEGATELKFASFSSS